MDVCCAAGAPVSLEYTPKGKYEQIGDMQVYITGEENRKAIISVYDIFGFSNQVQFMAFPPRECSEYITCYVAVLWGCAQRSIPTQLRLCVAGLTSPAAAACSFYKSATG